MLAILRSHLGAPISDLRKAITNRQPFLDEKPHHNQYTEFVERVATLLDDLDTEGIRYLVEIDGSPESPEYLRNVFQEWHDIGEQRRRNTDGGSNT